MPYFLQTSLDCPGWAGWGGGLRICDLFMYFLSQQERLRQPGYCPPFPQALNELPKADVNANRFQTLAVT